MRAVLLEKTDTLRAWFDSLGGPDVIPVRLMTCMPASSLSVIGLGASSVGRSFTGLTVMTKVRATVLLEPWPSLTTTVIVEAPKASGVGAKVSVPLLLELL